MAITKIIAVMYVVLEIGVLRGALRSALLKIKARLKRQSIPTTNLGKNVGGTFCARASGTLRKVVVK